MGAKPDESQEMQNIQGEKDPLHPWIHSYVNGLLTAISFDQLKVDVWFKVYS